MQPCRNPRPRQRRRLNRLPSQSANPASGQPLQLAAMAPPTTMDQVVDRTIVREHALMDMLKTRTPLVETYLQNLKSDPKLGRGAE